MRARRTKANEPDADYKVDDSPAMRKKAARQRAKGIAATAEAQPGSIAALADAADAAMRAASPKKKHPDDVTAKVAKELKRAIAAQEKVDAPAPKAAPDFNPLAGAGAASTALLKAASKKSRAPRAAASPRGRAPRSTGSTTGWNARAR